MTRIFLTTDDTDGTDKKDTGKERLATDSNIRAIRVIRGQKIFFIRGRCIHVLTT